MTETKARPLPLADRMDAAAARADARGDDCQARAYRKQAERLRSAEPRTAPAAKPRSKPKASKPRIKAKARKAQAPLEPLTPQVVQAGLAAMAARPPVHMRDRVRQRLHDRVHDVMAMESRHGSITGDVATEHHVACVMPDAPEPSCPAPDLGDGSGPVGWLDPVRAVAAASGYPARLGLVAMRRRRAWMDEHESRLRALEA